MIILARTPGFTPVYNTAISLTPFFFHVHIRIRIYIVQVLHSLCHSGHEETSCVKFRLLRIFPIHIRIHVAEIHIAM